MKKIIHIEDQIEWRDNVRSALMLDDSIEPVISYECVEDFRQANYPSANLYIFDRHLPDKRGQCPNDESWKTLFDIVNCLHPGIKVPLVILSSHPPKDWKKYRNVVDAIRKPQNPQDFDFAGFRNKIETYLGLTSGAVV